jgi:hypothetical protein
MFYDRHNTAFLRHYGVDVIFTATSTATPKTITGIYNSATLNEMLSSVPYESFSNTLTVKTSDVSTITKTSTFEIEDVVYYVVWPPKKDGTGFTEITLAEVING